jgi:hypothetical protein
VDDILIGSNNPMAVIKLLEKIYMFKADIPEYHPAGNVESLGEASKNQG